MASKIFAHNQRFWLSVGNKETDVNVSHPPSGLFQEINQIEGVRKAVALLQEFRGKVNYHYFKWVMKINPGKLVFCY